MSVKVFLLERRDIVRRGIKTILDKRTDVQVIGEARNEAEALEKVKLKQPDVILMDMSLPAAKGLDFTLKIKREYPRVKIGILTLHDYESNLIDLLQAGADGYIRKNTSENELIISIKKIANNEIGKRADLLPKFPEGSAYSLSEREKQVLDLIAEGLTNTEMAKRLFTSVRTIETRRKNLLNKTGTVNTATLIRFAVLNGLVK